jgi:hypothetical protein
MASAWNRANLYLSNFKVILKTLHVNANNLNVLSIWKITVNKV